ncbi:MAG: zf-HC2 domain-containing protein [Erythrobacter sp.]|uniref:anti-sigma factor family protein n=1 Tax=Erythrobacter sp. TaxID=1042 RepID=UPI0032653608
MHDHSHQVSPRCRMFRAVLRRPFSRKVVQAMGGAMLKYLPGQITCREFEDFLADYVEGRLTEKQLKLFDHHMAVCPFCRTSLAAYVKTIKMGQAVCAEDEKDHLFDRAPQQLIDAILDVTIYRA